MSEELITIGKLNGAFGIQGWVKVFSYSQPRDSILSYSTWMIQRSGQWQQVKVLQARTQGKTLVAQLEKVTDRNQAEALIGSTIAIHPEQLPATEPDEFYWRDLIGLRVDNLDGEHLGSVDSLLETGANDVLVVKSGESEQDLLVPFVMNEVVSAVDLEKGLITVDWQKDY